MSVVSGEVGNIVEMLHLTWSVLVGIGGECERKPFVVGKHVELPTFEKVLDSEVQCQELSIDRMCCTGFLEDGAF